MTTRLTLQQEKEFFKLAGFMLFSRYQVVSGRKLHVVNGHVKPQNPRLFLELSLLGYTDTVIEMELLLKSQSHTCQS